MQYQQALLIAHRGESFDAPENTLSAINLAWQKGAKGVEFDIQLTKDNAIVVFHDSHTARISGVHKIIKYTPFSELTVLDAGLFKDEQWKGERIPALHDVLKTVPDTCKIIIEIKSSSKILPFLKTELEQSGLQHHQIEIIAFNSKTLAKAKKLMPQYTMLWLLNLDYSLSWWTFFLSKKRILKKVVKNNFDGVDAFAGKMLDKDFIATFKKTGLLVYAWTVNNPKKAEQLILDGIDAVTTDRPYWLKLQLKHLKLR